MDVITYDVIVITEWYVSYSVIIIQAYPLVL